MATASTAVAAALVLLYQRLRKLASIWKIGIRSFLRHVCWAAAEEPDASGVVVWVQDALDCDLCADPLGWAYKVAGDNTNTDADW